MHCSAVALVCFGVEKPQAAFTDLFAPSLSLQKSFRRQHIGRASVVALLRYLNIEQYDAAIKIIEKYYPLERVPQKTLYALEEILEEK